MPDISKIKLPNNTTYDINDLTKIQSISASGHIITCTKGDNTSVDIPISPIYVKTADTSCNDYKSYGWYYFTSNYPVSGKPSGCSEPGYLFVLKPTSTTINQFWFDKDMSLSKKRISTNGNTWGSWTDFKPFSIATTSEKGLMSAADKTKLDSISIGYGEATVVANSDGRYYDVTIPNMTMIVGTCIYITLDTDAATDIVSISLNGSNYIPCSLNHQSHSAAAMALKSGITYGFVYDGNTWELLSICSVASSANPGLMSATDKTKLDSIPVGRSSDSTTGNNSLALGSDNTATRECSASIGLGLTSNDHSGFVCGRYNVQSTSSNAGVNSTAGNVLIIGNGSSSSNKSNAFRVTYTGSTAIPSGGAYNTSGADYAEFIKEWYDGNPDNEDRVGYMVTIKNGKLYKANEGDYIIGITSGCPGVIGNSDEEYFWRYERDKFNRIIYENVEENIVTTDDDGNDIIETVSYKRKKQSPNYDSSLQGSYIERKDRPEWDYVGMRGVVPCRDDGTCIPGQFCKCSHDGIATRADTRGFDTYYVIERIDDETISVEVK